MQSLKFLGAAFAAVLLSVSAAGAFSTDDKTLTQSNGAPKFSDPDDQMPSQIFSVGNSSSNYGEQDGNGNPQGSSSYSPSAAPFSPANGYNVPRH